MFFDLQLALQPEQSHLYLEDDPLLGLHRLIVQLLVLKLRNHVYEELQHFLLLLNFPTSLCALLVPR